MSTEERDKALAEATETLAQWDRVWANTSNNPLPDGGVSASLRKLIPLHSSKPCQTFRADDRAKAWLSFLATDSTDLGGDPSEQREAFDFAWDARGQFTPDEEAIKSAVRDAIYAERIEEGHPAKNTIRYELAETITQSVLALFNEKGNE